MCLYMNETTVRIKTYDGRVIEQTHRTNQDDAIKTTINQLIKSDYIYCVDIHSVWTKDNTQHWLENWSQVDENHWLDLTINLLAHNR